VRQLRFPHAGAARATIQALDLLQQPFHIPFTVSPPSWSMRRQRFKIQLTGYCFEKSVKSMTFGNTYDLKLRKSHKNI
jgi:hypothetical protein